MLQQSNNSTKEILINHILQINQRTEQMINQYYCFYLLPFLCLVAKLEDYDRYDCNPLIINCFSNTQVHLSKAAMCRNPNQR